MSDYYHLDVYKASYRLLTEIHASFKNLNREHKYTIGEKIKERTFEILIGIYRANRSRNKVPALAQALEDIEYIRLSLRLLRDLRVLNEKKYVRLVVLCEEVALQFEKWWRYEKGHVRLHSEPGSQASHRR